MQNEKFPLKQGDLDFLCGVYAAINAMHLRGEISVPDQAALPFRLALMFMQSHQQWDLAQAVCFGIDEADFYELLEQISWREWEYVQDPSEDMLNTTFDEVKNYDSLIVSLLATNTEAGVTEAPRQVVHYTVVTDTSPEGLVLFDSQGIETIPRQNGQLSYDNQKVTIGSIFIMRSK